MLTDTWRTSSFSGGNGCLSARLTGDGTVQIRDGKNPDGSAIETPAIAWNLFLFGIYNGEYEKR